MAGKEHRESDRPPDRLRPRVCRGSGTGSGGDEPSQGRAPGVDILVDEGRHRADALPQPPLHGSQLCRGADTPLLPGTGARYAATVYQVPLQC